MPGYEIRCLNESEHAEWDSLVDESPQGCIFCRSWWLEAVCPNGFELLTVQRGGRIIGGMPLPISRRFGQRIVSMPPLTQVLGGLLVPSQRTAYEGRLSEEMEVLERLVEAIPSFSRFSMNFHYSFTNWLPFYWAGYRQTTRYTYVIENLTDLDKVFSDFDHSKRKNIKKAEKEVSVHHDLPPEDFYANHRLTLAKQGESISYSFNLFSRIHHAALENEAGKTWYAIDPEGNIHAAIFVVFDHKSAYYLISTIDPDYRNSGAATLLLREAMVYVSRYTQRFDFEGSMIRGVERSFRRFGAVQTPYFTITKDNLSLPAKSALRMLGLTRGALRRAGLGRLAPSS